MTLPCTEIPWEDFSALFLNKAGVPPDDLPNDQLAELEEALLPLANCTAGKGMSAILCNVFNQIADCRERRTDSGSVYVFDGVPDIVQQPTTDGRPYLGMYKKTDGAHWELPKNEVSASASIVQERQDYAVGTSHGAMKLLVEVAWNTSPAFGFYGNELLYQRGWWHVPSARSRLVAHISEIFRHQHRLHVFSISVKRTQARVAFWDRSGAVVTDVLDLETHDGAKALLGFVYTVSCQMDETALGINPLAVLATEQEVQALAQYSDPNATVSEYLKTIADRKTDYPIYKIMCEDVSATNAGAPETADTATPSSSKPVSAYFVGIPRSSHHSIFGRATKGYIAFSPTPTPRAVFLKEIWKTDSHKVHRELDMYSKLHSAGVAFIPTVIGGGAASIAGERILTQSQKALGNTERLELNYLVLREIAVPLKEYKDELELIDIVLDALQAHYDAWTEAHILHHDISANNIMLDVETRRGLLIDWDLSKFANDLAPDAPRSGYLSGTWPFISALSLNFVRKPTELADDLESFVYVILYMAYRFHRHERSILTSTDAILPDAEIISKNAQNINLACSLKQFFHEEFPLQSGLIGGGDRKERAISIATPPIQMISAPNGDHTPLSLLIARLYQVLQHHYRAIDLEAMRRFKVLPHSPTVRPPKLPPHARKSERRHRPARLLRPLQDPHDASSSASTMTTSQANPEGERVLDSHDLLMALFVDILTTDITDPERWPGYVVAKTADQFMGLPDFVPKTDEDSLESC